MKKKLLILYENGTVKKKKETKISKDDINLARYFLVPTNDNTKNYAIIEPSKYVIFDKAIIDYQMAVAYPDEDNMYIDYEPLNPVHVETDSLCDVICLLNSIDRLKVANFIMTGDNISDDFSCLAIIYFGLTLISGNKVIYDNHYRLKGTSIIAYDSNKVGECFNEIYTPLLTKKLHSKKKKINLYSDGNEIHWDYGSIKKCTMVGIPLESNTITFCDYKLYLNLSKIDFVTLEVCIYYEKDAFIAQISESIVNGYFEEHSQDTFDKMGDVFYVDTYHVSVRSQSPHRLVDIMSHITFALSAIHLMYSELYQSIHCNGEKYDFDTILVFDIYKNQHCGKRFSINNYSIIDLEDILSSL